MLAGDSINMPRLTALTILTPRLCVSALKIPEFHPGRPDTESAPDALRPGDLGSSRPAPDSVVHVFDSTSKGSARAPRRTSFVSRLMEHVWFEMAGYSAFTAH